MIAIIKLIWRVVGGVSTYIHVHVAASCEKDEYQQPLPTAKNTAIGVVAIYPACTRAPSEPECQARVGRAAGPEIRKEEERAQPALQRRRPCTFLFLYSIVYGYGFLSLPCVS